jgi:nucleotide-binding universal stress UspA family protein
VAEELSGQVQALPEGAGSAHLRGIRVVEGHPSEVLLEVAREEAVDLIVMGTHRHSAMGELLLGSTAHRVAQRCRVPVLLVPLAG